MSLFNNLSDNHTEPKITSPASKTLKPRSPDYVPPEPKPREPITTASSDDSAIDDLCNKLSLCRTRYEYKKVIKQFKAERPDLAERIVSDPSLMDRLPPWPDYESKPWDIKRTTGNL